MINKPRADRENKLDIVEIFVTLSVNSTLKYETQESLLYTN